MNYQVKTPWPKVTTVLPLPDYRLQVVLDDDQELLLNLKNLVERRESYWRLRNLRYFYQVTTDPLGGICWPEGEDLAPDGLSRYLDQES